MKKVRKSLSVFIIATLIFFMSFSSIAWAEINQTVLTENQSMEIAENILDEGIPWGIPNTELVDNTIALTTNDWVSASAGWGSVQKDKNINNQEITLFGESGDVVTHETGIGTNANSTVIYDLTVENFIGYDNFETYVGIDAKQNHPNASVKFYVYLDDQIAIETEVVSTGMAQQKLQVELNNAKQLKLVVIGQGDEIVYDHANWGSPILKKVTDTESGGEKPKLLTRDYVYSFGEIVDLQSLVIATDEEDGNLTSQVVIETDYIDGDYGEFFVRYSVADTDGNTVSVTIQIYVPEPTDKFSNEQLQDFDSLLAINASIYDSLREIGFTDDQILRLSELPKKEDSFYEGMESPEPILENAQENRSDAIELSTLEPSESALIASRIANVTSIATRTSNDSVGSVDFNKETVYLYLSHYVDNPYYPNFTRAYCDLLVPEDREVYESYIQVGTAKRNAHNLFQMINKGTSIVYTSRSAIGNLQEIDSATKKFVTSVNDLRAINMDNISLATHADQFVDSFERNYESAENVEALLHAIHEDIAEKDFEKPLYGLYKDVVISAVLGNPVPTLILAGSSTYFETINNIADRAALAKVKYSTSLRITLRQYESW